MAKVQLVDCSRYYVLDVEKTERSCLEHNTFSQSVQPFLPIGFTLHHFPLTFVLSTNRINMETLTATSPVTFTANAIAEIKRLIAEGQAEGGKRLRVGVKGGGCSGMTYVLEFDMEQSGDKTHEIEGVSVLLNQAHELYLAGMKVDFGSGLNDRGFVFVNPNATKTCGCGTSFSV